MRNISFFLTMDQFRDRSKTVTRRTGWLKTKAGDTLMGVEKGQGIQKGGLVRLGPIRIIKATREPLNAITKEECIKEGFPEMEPADFIKMFCFANPACVPDDIITRLEYEYL